MQFIVDYAYTIVEEASTIVEAEDAVDAERVAHRMIKEDFPEATDIEILEVSAHNG